MFDVEMLFRYWRDFPPVHVITALRFGFGQRHCQPTQIENEFMMCLPTKSIDELPEFVQEMILEEQEKAKSQVN